MDKCLDAVTEPKLEFSFSLVHLKGAYGREGDIVSGPQHDLLVWVWTLGKEALQVKADGRFSKVTYKTWV